MDGGLRRGLALLASQFEWPLRHDGPHSGSLRNQNKWDLTLRLARETICSLLRAKAVRALWLLLAVLSGAGGSLLASWLSRRSGAVKNATVPVGSAGQAREVSPKEAGAEFQATHERLLAKFRAESMDESWPGVAPSTVRDNL